MSFIDFVRALEEVKEENNKIYSKFTSEERILDDVAKMKAIEKYYPSIVEFFDGLEVKKDTEREP